MSNLCLSTGDDYPDAAQKHVDDAVTLLNAQRFDNAAYLAGYVIECVLKTVIQIEQGSPWGHDINQLSQEAQKLASLPGAKTAHLANSQPLSHSIYDYGGSGWKETLRYRAPGTTAAAVAQDWVHEAQDVFDRVVTKLRLDGVL